MKETALAEITKITWIVITIAFLISLLTQNISIILGILSGALLGLLNFKVLSLTTQKALKSDQAKVYVFSSYIVRLSILGLILALIFTYIKTIGFIISFIIGLSIVIVAISIEGVINFISYLKVKEDKRGI